MADNVSENKTAITPNEGGGNTVAFSEEQQKAFDSIIEKRLSRAHKDLRAELDTIKTEKETLLKQLEEAKQTQSTARSSKDKSDAADDVQAIKNQLEELQKANKTLLTEKDEVRKAELKAKQDTDSVKQQMLDYRKKTEMQFAAQKVPFIDLEAIIVLTERYVKYDPQSNDFLVVNEKGGERYSTTNVGELMTLEEFYNEYAQQKKHLVRSDVVVGTGSTESLKSNFGKTYKLEDLFGPGSDAKKANELAKTDKLKYQEFKQEAVRRGLIGGSRV